MSEIVTRYRSARSDPALVVLEGLHAIKHALRFGADLLEARTADGDAVLGLASRLAPDIVEGLAAALVTTEPATFEALAPSPPSTGVLALARRPAVEPAMALAEPGPAPAVLLERPTHHGNIGAVVRVAAAAGAAAVLVTGPHDPWHPASVRGGAGLQFALPVAAVADVLEGDRPVVVLDAGGEPLDSATLPPRALLVFGSERTGVSPALLERAQRRLAIPMRPGVSSLNLATSVAIALYHRRGA